MNKKKFNQTKSSDNSKVESEFDVRKNLQKLKSGRNSTDYVTGQQVKRATSSSEYITNEHNRDSSTSDLVEINDNMHLRYDQLKDSFHFEINEIKKDHSTFVKEIFEKYVSKTEFYIILGGLLAILCVIGTIFYTLSYESVTSDIEEIKRYNNENMIVTDEDTNGNTNNKVIEKHPATKH